MPSVAYLLANGNMRMYRITMRDASCSGEGWHDMVDDSNNEKPFAVWWRDEGNWVKAYITNSMDDAYNWAMAAAVYDPTLVGVAGLPKFDTPGYAVY